MTDVPASDDVTRELPAAAPDDLVLPGEDDLWPTRGPARGVRLAVPAAALLAVLLVGAGFWGGATVEKHHGSSSGTSGAALASRLRSAFASARVTTGASGAAGAAGASGATGFGFGGGSTAAATGTISVVDGKTLYVLTDTGSIVKVVLDPSTAITRDASSTAVGLRPGDTVVVQGSTTSNGSVSASSVSATAPGVSSTGAGRGFGGGGGGFGGGFGGNGAGATTTTPSGGGG